MGSTSHGLHSGPNDVVVRVLSLQRVARSLEYGEEMRGREEEKWGWVQWERQHVKIDSTRP